MKCQFNSEMNKLPSCLYYFTAFVVLTVAAIYLVGTYIGTGTWNFPTDDPYIYLQYVVNAANGDWFQYNLGEYTGGITGFLWYLLLVPIYKVIAYFSPGTEGLIWASHILSTVLTYFTLVFAAEMIFWRTRNVFLSFLVVPLALLHQEFLWASWGGLEGPIAAFVSVIAARLFVKEILFDQRVRLSGIVSGFFYWARPESILIPFFWSGFYVLFGKNNRAQKIKTAIVFLIPVVLLFIVVAATYYYFTGIFTQSAIIKFDLTLILHNHGIIFDILRYFKEWIWILSILNVVLIFQALRNKEYVPELIIGLGLFSLMLMDMFLGILPNIRDRYMSWMIPLILVLSLTALSRLSLLNLFCSFCKISKKYVLLLVCVVTFVFAGFFTKKVIIADTQCMNDVIVAVGQWIDKNLPQDALIASEPIGSTKLFGNRRFFDIVGVTSSKSRGTYQKWDITWKLIKEVGAGYFIFSREGIPPGSEQFLHPIAEFYGPTCTVTYKTNALYRVDL